MTERAALGRLTSRTLVPPDFNSQYALRRAGRDNRFASDSQRAASIRDGTQFRGRPDTTHAPTEQPLDGIVSHNNYRIKLSFVPHGKSLTQHQMENLIFELSRCRKQIQGHCE